MQVKVAPVQNETRSGSPRLARHPQPRTSMLSERHEQTTSSPAATTLSRALTRRKRPWCTQQTGDSAKDSSISLGVLRQQSAQARPASLCTKPVSPQHWGPASKGRLSQTRYFGCKHSFEKML